MRETIMVDGGGVFLAPSEVDRVAQAVVDKLQEVPAEVVAAAEDLRRNPAGSPAHQRAIDTVLRSLSL